MAVDHHVTFPVVFGNDHNDGRLLTALSQRCQQPALPVRLADSQMRPLAVELVKLQLHRCLLGFQYARNRDWSLEAKGEVCREPLWDQ
jgi:hypothetical protein